MRIGVNYVVEAGRVFHFRYTVPQDVRPYVGRTEIKRSLGTVDWREAAERAEQITWRTLDLVRSIRKHMAEADESLDRDELISEIVRRAFEDVLAADEMRDQLDAFDSRTERVGELQQQVVAAKRCHLQTCEILTTARGAASGQLAEAIRDKLHRLGFLQSRFAVTVCEADPGKVLSLSPTLKLLGELGVPHMIFVNKIDRATGRVRDLLAALQGISEKPLVLRQVPIRDGETITGYVDLISERAYAYHPGAASDLISIPENLQDMEQAARMEMLEKLADFDDDLLTKLLEDAVPSKDEIYENFRKDLGEDSKAAAGSE